MLFGPFAGEIGSRAACPADQIFIETAQSGLDCAVMADMADSGKTIILGVLDLNDVAAETPAVIADRVRRAVPTFRRSGSCSRLTAA